MNGTAHIINAAKRGYLLPSKIHPLLRPLDPWSDTSRVLIAPLIQLFLVSLFWVTYASSFTIYEHPLLITRLATAQRVCPLASSWYSRGQLVFFARGGGLRPRL